MTNLEDMEKEADYQAEKVRQDLAAKRYAIGLLTFAWCVIGGIGTILLAALWWLVKVLGGSV